MLQTIERDKEERESLKMNLERKETQLGEGKLYIFTDNQS